MLHDNPIRRLVFSLAGDANWLNQAYSLAAFLIGTTILPVTSIYAASPEKGIASLAASQEYRLGPLDKLRVRVFEWRPSRDEIFEWAALNAEYTIGASGHLSLPLIGEIPAGGMSTSDLAGEIGNRLRERMGLVGKPDITLEIIQFRPFYITGHVQKPGEYPYRPGMTVLQAQTIGGGLQRTHEGFAPRLEREVIVAHGDIEALEREAVVLIGRKARLESELKGADNISFPEDFSNKMRSKDISVVISQERLIFEARKEALETQTKALKELLSYLNQEVVSISSQLASHETQLQLVREELSAVSSLAEKGLTTAPRRLALERVVAQLDGDKMRLLTNLHKAKQDISRTELSIVEMHNKRVTDITMEVQQVQARLEQVRSKAETTERLLYETEVIAPRYLGDQTRGGRPSRPVYTIYRQSGGQIFSFSGIDESMSVSPGDTVKVELPNSFQDGGATPNVNPGEVRFSQEGRDRRHK